MPRRTTRKAVQKSCAYVETMLGNAIATGVNAAFDQTPFARTETFENPNGEASPARSALVVFLTVSIVFVLLLAFGQYLWNNVLVALVPGVKKSTSIFQILGLAFLIALLHPGSCTC